MKEIARYLGIKLTELDDQTKKCICEMKEKSKSLSPKSTYAFFDIKETNDGIILVGSNIILTGNLAKKHFADCKKLIVVLATLGLKSEIMMKQMFALSGAKGVVFDAVCTDKLENYLDELELELKKNQEITTRISCGYGDLPLAVQKDLFAELHGENLGVKLNDCFMLTPNKSVIALIGVK